MNRLCEKFPEYQADSYPHHAWADRCECGRWRISKGEEMYGPVWVCPKEDELRSKPVSYL